MPRGLWKSHFIQPRDGGVGDARTTCIGIYLQYHVGMFLVYLNAVVIMHPLS